jgi:putative hydrolase of the HAD superfamily
LRLNGFLEEGLNLHNSEAIKRLKDCQGILFDLDNTLYPRERGVFLRISERIDQYVARRSGLSGDEVRPLRREYIDRYGTTLGGLMRHHDVDPDEYTDYVHAVPVEEMLVPDKELDVFLNSIELPRVIFTNATAVHATRVLDALGVRSHFESIVDLADTGYLGKPDSKAFMTAVDRLGYATEELLFVDDLQVNVEAASQLGILTAHVSDDGNGVGDFSVERVTELGDIFSGMIWFNGG